MDSHGTFGNIDFWYHAGTGLPSVGKNDTATTQDPSVTQLAPGALMMHPGDNAATTTLTAVSRWTAPADGEYDVAATFTGLDSRGVDVVVGIASDGSGPTPDFIEGKVIGRGSS